MARAKKPATPTPVVSVRHQDKRVNIPTDELRDFVSDAEEAPTTLLYPRDPSLDPQLVWKGKDEQDRQELAVPTVPIYIQEKIDPRVLVENLRNTAAVGEREPELTLFERFDGPLEFDQIVDFYKWPVNWSNRMILGDSLLVMTSLAEKENLKGKVQMIYLDPPYGIKFGSNWQVSTRKRDVKDGKAEDLTRQPEQIRAFRDTWELGIHSYLGYLRDRLTVARELLTESGSVFVQIGDENVHLVRNVLDEVFGSENFVSLITFKKTSGAGSFAGGTNVLAATNDFLLWYARDAAHVKYRQLFRGKEVGGLGGEQYSWVEDPDGSRRRFSDDEAPSGAVFRPAPLTSQTVRPAQTTVFEVEVGGTTYVPGKGGWKTNRDGMRRLALANRLIGLGKTLQYVRYLDDFPAFPINNLWEDTVTSGFGEPKLYVVQTNAKVVERCLLMATDPGDLVLDPTCGSGTTAYVAEQWGRRWITIDTSRVSLALARTRLMAAKYPYHLLADSADGAAKEAELTSMPATGNGFEDDVRKGFVYKRVPHITLKSIAQNPNIKEGVTREEADAAIARHAETELLVDQPYEDRKRVRVSGPFTVESLSPHRVLDEEADRTVSEQTVSEAGTFVEMILANLRKAGVQNTKREERLTFDWLEPFAGEWISGEGEYTDSDGITKRVAVSIGPEHGTVGPLQVKEAAKEAVKGRGFDVLVVCGFAFDARVGETAREFGKLVVLPAHMNPDLAMGDELLKKTGAGNLFMVFGEPDLTVKHEDGQVTIELRGVDVYDPTTGEVRSSSTEDVACWFVDTDYNGESFFVRHAYFTGAGDPYERLRKGLRADIDEGAWSSLYSTVSRPFDAPSTGKIAVKVINHYGDEVMHVYDV
ncbi:MAG TPA: site-specific DNA-methyltransferase [Acidimicrobiia bacterium]|jgi:adenine-specific DNA-methyltransferase